MGSKKKMIIAISAFALVVIATVISVVAVLAATSVTLTTNVTVSYTVSDVVADFKVYAVKVKNNATSINWGTEKVASFGVDGYISGTGSQGTVGEDEATIGLTAVDLLKDECLVLKFVFENNSVKAFTGTLNHTDTTNQNVTIAYASGSVSKPGDITGTTKSTVSVASGDDKSATYYVKVSISDAKKNVTDFNPAFAWTLV